MKNSLKIVTIFLSAILLIGCQNYAPAVDELIVEPPVVDEPTIQPAMKDDLIRLDSPLPESKISSPLVVEGAARGNWFFEASFPIILTDWDGLIIADGYATAEGDWMTPDYVPFRAELTFEKLDTVSNRGALILKKDNPSGLPENDNALEITIFFE